MGSYKKIGLSHEIGLIDTPPFSMTENYCQAVGTTVLTWIKTNHWTKKNNVQVVII